MIKRLLILVLICCAICLVANAQQPPVHTDTLSHIVDSPVAVHPVPDTARPVTDTVHPVPPPASDSLRLLDSLKRAADSLLTARHRRDSTRNADSVLSATALLHQIDSANAASSFSQTPPVDSLKLRMDAMMAAAAGNNPNNRGSNGPPGLINAQRQAAANNAYTPAAGSVTPPPPTIADSARNTAAATGPPKGFHSNPAPLINRNRKAPPATLSNYHRKFIAVHSGRIPVDSLSLVPGTFFVKDVPDSAYLLDWVNGSLIWQHPPAGTDSILVFYRTFPYKLNAVAKRFNYDSIESYFLVRPYDRGKDGRNNTDNFFNFGNIAYNGSFGRSITFGNSQNAVVTSNLNLQISGYLADSIRIDAAITDNNIPIQPDGTTADLNEFDKIFLQFSKKNWTLTMGDIDLKQNQNYFLSFYKRLQGASFETTEQIDAHTTNKVLASAAIAKGKFNRNIFEGQEGNQGPYQLSGANGELFFIVLAGTEKVYIDGQLMQRGEDQDYTINYNTAEVTFTPNRQITQDARIQVEFEYADRNYLNVNLYLYDEAKIGSKLRLRMGLFSNSDARNSPINQALTPDENKFLSRLGDSITHAYYPVANVDTLAPGKILYQKVDTTYKNAAGVLVHDSIFEFSANTALTLYNLSFANVGQGYGNYVPDLNGVNGNVYIWIAPVNGVSQGSYEAAEFLVTPKTQQIMTIGADYAVDKNTTITAEAAKSHYDVNTLSTIDKSNDNGYAAKLLFKNVKPVGPAIRGLQLTTNLGYEYVQKNFTPLEPLRSLEFTRDWGLTLSVNPADEKIYNASFLLSDKKLNSIKYQIDRYERGDGFIGMRNTITQRQAIGKWNIADQVSLTTSDSNSFSGYYLRPSVDISRKLSFLGNYTIGGNYALEHNQNLDKKADTLSSTSFSFHSWTAYLKSPEKSLNHWGMSYTERDNSDPVGKTFAVGDRSKTLNIFADFVKNPHEQFHVTATYRSLTIVDSAVAARSTDSAAAAQGSDNSLLGRVEYLVNEWKGLLKGNLLYEIGSGQQQKQSYTYLQVPAGTGQYAWIDANKDGIQQLNEFVLAQFSDQAQYIRVYTPTNEYVKDTYNTFNYSFSITPKAVIGPKSSRFHLFLARMLFQSSLQTTQKQQSTSGIQWNPFKSPLQDTALITRSLIMVNTFSFNRTDPHWGFDLSNTRNGSKSLLTYGYEARQSNEWSVRTRLNLNKTIALTSIIREGYNQLNNSSSNFDSSNYNLRLFSIEPDLTYTRKSNLRIGLGYRLSTKLNSAEWGGQDYTSTGFNTDFKYNILSSTSIQGKFTVSSIMYTSKQGQPSTTSPVAYTILEGLAPGTNYLWNLDFTKKLGNNLEISLQYEGRKAADAGIVHTGRASLRALL